MLKSKVMKSNKGIVLSFVISLLAVILAFCAYFVPQTQNYAIAETSEETEVDTQAVGRPSIGGVGDLGGIVGGGGIGEIDKGEIGGIGGIGGIIDDNWTDIEIGHKPVVVAGTMVAISSAEELVSVVTNVNSGSQTYSGKTVYLTTDIDLSGKIWTPIGISTSNYFKGTFDGRGYKITGLTINETTNYTYQGLFGYIGASSTIIRNLVLEGVNIESDAEYIGGLVGNITSNTSNTVQILNCGVSGLISKSNSTSATSNGVGGLIGYCEDAIVSKCFSTTAMSTSSGTKTGGLIGSLRESSSSVTVSRSFYYSEAGISSNSSYQGFIGWCNNSATADRVTDVYTSSNYLYTYGSSPTKNTSKSKQNNSSYWYQDSSGIMHGVSKNILKGVGNIFVETSTKKAIYSGTSLSESESSANYYIYNVLTGEMSGATKFTADSNYNYPLVEVQRFVSGKSGSDIITTLSTDTSANTKTFLYFGNKTEGKGGNIYYDSSSRDNFTSSKTTFTLSNSRASSNNDIAVSRSSANYTFNMGNVAGYYKITLHSRGAWKQVKFIFFKYTNVSASMFMETDDFTTNIQPVETYDSLYKNTNLSFTASTTGWTDSNSGSRTVYIPYDEPYKISFSASSNDGISYLDMMTEWGSATTSNSGAVRISTAVKLEGISPTDTTDLPQSGTLYTSSSTIKSDTTNSYYFNNIQTVNVRLYSSSDSLHTKYHDISGTYPSFVNSGYIPSTVNTSSLRTISINVMANGLMNLSGFSIGNVRCGGSGKVYAFCRFGSSVSGSTLGQNGAYVPYWPEFCLDGLYLGSTKLIDNTAVDSSYGTNLQPTLKCESYTWRFRGDSKQTLVAKWVPFEASTDVEFDKGSGRISPNSAVTNGIILRTGADYKVYEGTSYGTSGFSSLVSGPSTSFKRESDESAVIRFTISQGYQLKNTSMTLYDGNFRALKYSGAGTISNSNETYPITYYFEGKNNLLLKNEIEVNWNKATNSVVVTFSHLMGIGRIVFGIEPRTFDFYFGAATSDGTKSANNVVSVNYNNSAYQLNTNNRVSVSYTYGSDIVFSNVGSLPGYTFRNEVNVYSNGNNPAPALFDVSSNGSTITLKRLNWSDNIDNIQSIRVEFVVIRNETKLEINFGNGLNSNYLKDIRFDLVGGVDTSTDGTITSTTVRSDDIIKFTAQFSPNIQFVQVNNVTYDLAGNSANVTYNVPTRSLALDINNILVKSENSGKIVVNIQYKIFTATVNVIRRDTLNGRTISETPVISGKSLTYEFRVLKAYNDATINFQDINNGANNFSTVIDYSSSAVSKIELYKDSTFLSDITNNSSVNQGFTFSDGATINFYIVYEQRTAQVQLARAKVANGSKTISSVTNISNSDVTVGGTITLKDGSAPAGYSLLGWYYIGSETQLTLSNMSFSNASLIPANVSSVTLLKPGEQSTQTAIAHQNFMYFVAVYEAKIYTLSFDTSQILDSVQNKYYDVVLSNNDTLTIEYDTNTIKGGSIPTASLRDNPMLYFVGWQNAEGSYSLKFDYNQGQNSFSVTASWKNVAPSSSTIRLVPQPFKETTVTLYYCHEDGTRTGQTTTVLYGGRPSNLSQPSARQGYAFSGWTYNGTLLYPFANNSWGNFQPWTYMVREANILPKWDAVSVNVKLHSGLGSFQGNVQTISGSVLYGTNNYSLNSGLSNPTWSASGATYTFAGYYRNVINGKNYYFYGVGDSRNTVCDIIPNEGITLYACYNLASVNITLSVPGRNGSSWVYDGNSSTITASLPNNLPLITNSTSFTKDGKAVSASVKDVVDSGLYNCTMSISGGETTTNGVKVFTTGTITANAQIQITISPKTVTVSQNGAQTNVIRKVFDNTTYVSNISFNGFVTGDSVSGSVEFVDKNVGTNKEMRVTISGSDSSNYVCQNITGEITPFVIVYNVSGARYKVGADSDKITIPSENIKLSDESSRFLTSVGANPTISLRTSRNVVGVYTYGGSNNIEVASFSIGGNNVDANNFSYTIQGQFEIVNAGAEDVVVQIRLNCEDGGNINIASLGSIAISGSYAQVTGNNSQNVYVVDSKSKFGQNSTISFVLTRDVNYWVDRVVVNNAEVSVNINSTSNQDNISYSIQGAVSNSIIIDIYITTLSNITFNYALYSGESLSGSLPTTTRFAYQKTISASIQEVGAVLPNVQRVGFVFTGWKIEGTNVDVTSSTIWSYRGDRTLVAQYQIANILAEFYVDEVKGDIVSNSSSYEAPYDGASHVLRYLITNQNTTAINYSYAWTQNSAQTANTSNSLTVSTVLDSGSYVLTIRAVSKQNSLVNTTLVLSLNVKINPAQLFSSGYVIAKEYDGTTSTGVLTISKNGQTIQVVGIYTSKNAGSGLDTTLSRWTINGARADSTSLNYALNFNEVNMQASVINPKNLTLTANATKSYDGKVLTVTGSYTDKTPFDYTISTVSANVGTYTQGNSTLNLAITGDTISNFNITISGSLIITQAQIDIVWQGATTVTYDGKYHALTPIVPSYLNITGITYSVGGRPVYEYSSLADNTGALDANAYTVSIKYDTTNTNIAINNGVSTSLTINKRTIYVSYEGIFAEKVYDGTSNVITQNVASIYDNSALDRLLSSVIPQQYMPQLAYTYVNQVAGQNKEINVELVDSTNYVISSSFDTLLGNISKRDATIYITSTKTFDMTPNYVVEAKDIRVENIVEGEVVTGSVVFNGVSNSGNYYDLKSREKVTSGLYFGAYKFDTNYNATFVDSTLEQYQQNFITINKAQVTVSTDKNKQYVYSGEEVEITFDFVNLTNPTVVPSKDSAVFVYTAVSGSLDNNKAVQIGSYTYSMTLSGLDGQNFDISGDVNNVAFGIIARTILIEFTEDIIFEYQNTTVTYKKDNGQTPNTNEKVGNDRSILGTATLGVGDVFDWAFTTKSKDFGTYYINNDSLVTRVLKVTKNGVDYTKNYNFEFETYSAIIINKQTINFNEISFVEATSEYNGLVKEISITFYDKYLAKNITFKYGDEYVTFNNLKFVNSLGEDRQINSPQEVKYAGTYSFGLEFTNYLITNSGTLSYVITPCELDLNITGLSKVYDGTTVFTTASLYSPIPAGSTQGENRAPYEGDAITLVGNYAQKDVGKNIPVTFTLSSSDLSVLGSYFINAQNYNGEITQKEITLSLQDDYYTYYTGEQIEIDIATFNKNALDGSMGLVNNEMMQGLVVVPVVDVGSYELSTLDLSKIAFNITVSSITGDSLFTNYKITKVSGLVVVQHAQVVVSISDTSKIYNGNVQGATITYSASEGHGLIVDSELKTEIVVTYTNSNNEQVSPRDAGTYNIVLSTIENSNYRLINDAGEAVPSFTSVLKLIINKRDVAVNVNYTHTYNGEIARYTIKADDVGDPTQTKSGGLVSGQILTGTLLTNDFVPARYSILNQVFGGGDLTSFDVYPQDVKINIIANAQDVTSNYNIIYTAVILILADVQNINSSAIEIIEYCAQDVTKLDTFAIEFTFGDSVYQIKYNQSLPFGEGYTATLSGLALYQGGTDATQVGEAKDVGQYRLTLSITNEYDELNVADKYINFTVVQRKITQIVGDFDKYYDGTSIVINALSSPQIYDDDRSGVVIVGQYIQNSSPTFAVGTHAISFTLQGDRANNYQIALESTIMGTISKQPIVLTLKQVITVYYTGEATTLQITQFKALKSNDANSEIVDVVNNLTGTTIDILEVNANTYTLENLFAQNSIRINISGSIEILDNYQIVGYSGQLVIKPCEVEVSIDNISTTYNAQSQGITYELFANNGSILESERDGIITVLYDNSETLPINAKQYQLTLKISDKYANNYVISKDGALNNSFNFGTFTILRREIAINIGDDNELIYTGTQLMYTLTSDDILPTQTNPSGLISSHTIVGGYLTSGSDYVVDVDGTSVQIVYTIGGDTYYLTLTNFDILQGETSVLANYEIKSEYGSVQIVAAVAGEVDSSHLESLVYSATDYTKTGDIQISVGVTGVLMTFVLNQSHPNGSLTNLLNADKQPVSEAKYVGTYYVYLTITGTDIDNKEFEFTIKPKEITEINYTHDKNYDRTSNILGEITSSQIYEEDRQYVQILGNYVDDQGTFIATKGEHFVKFEFSGSGIREANYTLVDYTQNKGSILARNIVLQINQSNNSYLVYYTNEVVNIDSSVFSAYIEDNNEQITDFNGNVTGYVAVSLFDANTYNLADNFDKIDLTALLSADGSDYLENYNITLVKGNLVIEKAQVLVAVSDYEKVYNGQVQTPTFTLSINSGHGKLAHENILSAKYKLDSSSEYITSPINVGTYDILLSIVSEFASNYTLFFNDVVENYTAVEKLVISPKGVVITVNPAPYTYTGSNIQYNITSADVEGLADGHSLVGTLTTNGHRGGIYTFNDVYVIGGDYSGSDITPNIEISSSTSNTTSNYTIRIDAQITIISSLTQFDTSALNGLVYDKTDKVENGLIVVSLLVDDQTRQFVYGNDYGEEATFSAISYVGESTQATNDTAIYAGEYTFIVNFNINGASLSQTVTFVISPKTISQVTLQNDKVYDATNIVLNEITSTDVIDTDVVVISGIYSSANAGSHDIELSISGVDAFNYVLNENLGLTGVIEQRAITLNVNDPITYLGENPQITPNNLTVGGLGLVDTQVLSGYIVLLRKDAGTYEFVETNIDVSNFKILSGEDDVTTNYAITYQGNVVISALGLTLVVNTIDLTYDAQIKDIRPNLMFSESLTENVLAEALKAIAIEYDRTPLNAGDYKATISSNSSNFTITYGEDNIVDFTIKQRDLQINIGEIEYDFNPTSTHETPFSSENLVGLVEGQVAKGSFALSQEGLGVGEYFFVDSSDEIGVVVKSLAIFVNGEDILALNYNLNAEKLGSITIIPFVLSSDSVWLTTNQFVYDGEDVTQELEINFKDANGINRRITSTDTNYGTFTITGNVDGEGLAKNVGDYQADVVITNYSLENSLLAFSITPKTISNITYTGERVYNGTSYVYNSGSRNLFSLDIAASDRTSLLIYGYFVDEEGNYTSSVGEHKIAFEFNKNEGYPAQNYLFNVDAFGEILAKDVEITITYNFAYSAVGNYSLTVEESQDAFKVNDGGLVASQTLQGQISLNNLVFVIGKIDAKQIDTSALLIVDESKSDVTSNYNITIISNIEIVKAQIDISFLDIPTSFVYNKSQVVISPEFTFVNANDEVLPEYLTTSYTGDKYSSTDAPINVGKYTVTYSVATDYFAYYEIVSNNTFDFEITTYNVVIAVGEIDDELFFKRYGESDPELKYVITTEYDENVTVTFSREPGESIGRYDIYIEEWDNTNYSVTFADGAGNDLFRITKAGTLNIVILDTQNNIDLLQKIYDNQNIQDVDITTLDIDANGEVVTGFVSFSEGVNVGEYQLATNHNILNNNYESFYVTSLVTYKINPKPISLVVNNGNKEYDASNTFFGTISILDSDGVELDSGRFLLTASAVFESVNVAQDIPLEVTFSGDNIQNYTVTNSVSANITKRAVLVTPDADQMIEYGTQGYVITYQVEDLGQSNFTGNFTDEITGELYVDNYDAGEREIVSNLTSQNLDIQFTAGITLLITPKQLTISSSDDFQKVYDTTDAVLGELTVEGIIPGDDVQVTARYDSAEVGNNKTVIFTLSGLDKDNYFAQDVLGIILERGVTLNYVYIVEGFAMLNPELLENTTRQSDSLVYGSAIKDSIGTLPVPSHEGYDFDGWYLDEEFKIKITDDTVIDESIWSLDVDAKTAYAKWTIKQFNFTVLVATRVDGNYVTDAENAGGTHNNLDGLYDYGEVIVLTDMATANYGYEFVGYSYGLLLDADATILENGITMGAKDVTLYAKFAPLTVTITLNSNGGVFDTDTSGWVFNTENTTATREVEFNSVIGTELPYATRVGYTQDITLWDDEDNISHTLTSDTVMGEDFYPECTFYVHFDADDYTLTLDANGGYFENVDESVWTIVSTDADSRATAIQKQVVYDSPVGEVLIPVRAGYDFGSWSVENFDETFIWKTAGEGEVEALWEEKQFNIEITSIHGIVEYKVVNSSLLDVSAGRVDNTTQTITLMTTDRLILTAINDAGYTFSKWISDNLDINDVILSQVTTSNEFIQDYTVKAVFEANDNDITIVVSDAHRGYVTANGESTDLTTSQITVTIKTGETLDIVATANEGYTITDWIVTGVGDIVYDLSGTSIDSQRTLSDFVSDVTVTVYFEPIGNDLTISADETKATIHYMLGEEEIITSGSYTVRNVLTESVFEFDIVALHGYKVDLNLDNWTFETDSQNKGNIEVTSEDDGYTAHVVFTGFTSDGTIVVPFVNDIFDVEIGVVLKDGTTFKEYDVEDIVSVENNDMTALLSTGEYFTGEYLSQVILSVQDIIEGYDFLMYSISATRVEAISEQTGFVGYTEGGDLIYSIVDDMTLYLVYEIKSFDVTYVVNDDTMGYLSYGVDGNTSFSRTISVKYGYDAPSITAVNNEQFKFTKWIRVELVDGVYQPYLVNGAQVEYDTPSLIVENVTENCTFMAMFEGIPVDFRVSLVLPDDDVFTDEEIDFASLKLSGDNATISSSQRDGNTITYVISTMTGEDIDMYIETTKGYVYEGIISMDPRLIYNITNDENGATFSIENLIIETIIELSIRAKVYKISFNLVGESGGAGIYPYEGIAGVVGTEYSFDRSSLIISAKNGCDVQSLLYVLKGYKLKDNEYFELLGDQTMEDSQVSASYLGRLENVGEDLQIDIEINPSVYSVTFDLAYDVEQGNRTTTSVISHGKTEFDPVLTEDFTKPVRYSYNFIGYTTVDLSSSEGGAGKYYYFDEGGIYSLVMEDNTMRKVYGFLGAENATVSMADGVDYDVTLYATWEPITYEIELVYVPDFAVNKTEFNYNEIFPNSDGRKEIIEGDSIVGIEYRPGSTVTINAPLDVFEGFSYYGWSYVDGITSKVDENLNVGACEFEMGEEKVVIYLYYAMSVTADATQGGQATVSSDLALYGETITISAESSFGYFFDHWLENSNTVANSKATMEMVINAPTEFEAVFVGEKISVNVVQVANATLSITATTGVKDEYRIGDTITLTISNLTYGYEHRGWTSGGYSGTINSVDSSNFTYTIIPDDLVRGFVTFELRIQPRTVNIRFNVVGEGDCGDILVSGSTVAQQTLSYIYDTTLSILVNVMPRYELISFTLNGTQLSLDSEFALELIINQTSGFSCDTTNEFVATFRKMLWTDVKEGFTGLGTKDSPYLIKTQQQLAGMAYLINNNIAVEVGATPYADAYYLIDANLPLTEKFWVPIGTMENPFNGTFDLNAYDITDLEPNDWANVTVHPDGMPYGLFGYIGSDAKFITGHWDYTTTLIIIFSIIGAIILIILIVVLILMLRRKRMRRMSEASTNLGYSPEELLNAQKERSKRKNK